MRAIDCQGLGGGLTLGMVQAGFNVVAKHEQPGGFGFAQVEANRPHLGLFPLDDSPANEWFHRDWELNQHRDVALVFGCPPCSGFSMLSVRAGGRDMRGVDAAVNHCMWDLWRYAAEVQPTVIAMESVQAAGRLGLPLMQALVHHLEETTGAVWYTSHVFHNALSVGGPSNRPRYFLVASRRGPLGITSPQPPGLPVVADVLGDLEPLSLTWAGQDRIAAPGWWATRKADTELVTGHQIHEDHSAGGKHLRGCLEVGWPQGEQEVHVVRHHWEATGGRIEDDVVVQEGEWPPGWDTAGQDRVLHRPLRRAKLWDRLLTGELTTEEYLAAAEGQRTLPSSRGKPFQGGAYQPRRWRWQRPALVLAGNAHTAVVHPTQPRTLTYREIARVMGFPDSWDLTPYRGRESVFGKAVTVDVGYWLGYWLQHHLRGIHQFDPALWYGDQTGDREWTIDITHDWKALVDDKTGERQRRARQLRPA